MGAAHHRRERRVTAGTLTDDVADPVDADVEAEILHPRHDQIPAGTVLVGEREAGAAATLDRADLRQIGQPPKRRSVSTCMSFFIGLYSLSKKPNRAKVSPYDRRMPAVKAEFTIEPFVDGAPGPHVTAGLDAVRAAGLSAEIGPFGTSVEGDAALVHAALGRMLDDALAAGRDARVDPGHARWPDRVAAHPFLVALRPVAKALGATIVTPSRMQDSDIPLHWQGALVGGLRMPDLQDALARLIAGVEQQLGGSLASMSREDKQRAVRMLEERGAFQIRKSIDDVADAMGVSRITVYNYLNAIRDRSGSSASRVDGRAS